MAKIISTCYAKGMITPAQCRAARGLVDWSQARLAEAAGVGIVTIRQFENDGNKAKPRPATLRVIERAFTTAGVEFTSDERGEGVVKLRG